MTILEWREVVDYLSDRGCRVEAFDRGTLSDEPSMSMHFGEFVVEVRFVCSREGVTEVKVRCDDTSPLRLACRMFLPVPVSGAVFARPVPPKVAARTIRDKISVWKSSILVDEVCTKALVAAVGVEEVRKMAREKLWDDLAKTMSTGAEIKVVFEPW